MRDKLAGWLDVSRGDRKVWVQISNIEAVTFDGYGTNIVMISGNTYEGYGNPESTIARIKESQNALTEETSIYSAEPM